MPIHFSRPAATLSSEDLIVVTQQVITEIGDVGGLPTAGAAGSFIVSDGADWDVTASGTIQFFQATVIDPDNINLSNITSEGMSSSTGMTAAQYLATTCEVYFNDTESPITGGFTGDVTGILVSSTSASLVNNNAQFYSEGVYGTSNVDNVENRIFDLSTYSMSIWDLDLQRVINLNDESIDITDAVLDNHIVMRSSSGLFGGGPPFLTLTSSGVGMYIDSEGITFSDDTVQTTAVSGYSGSFTIDAVTYTYTNGLLASVAV